MIDLYSSNLHYLDPGTGSYLYQVLIAAGITLGIYFKSLKVFLVNALNKLKKIMKF
jgi:hypothetical protein